MRPDVLPTHESTGMGADPPEPSPGRVPEPVSKSVPEAGTGFTVGTLGGLHRQRASPKLPNSPPNGGRIQRLKI